MDFLRRGCKSKVVDLHPSNSPGYASPLSVGRPRKDAADIGQLTALGFVAAIDDPIREQYPSIRAVHFARIAAIRDSVANG